MLLQQEHGIVRQEYADNKIMIEKGTRITKHRTFKTQPFYQSQYNTFELGKPIVKLPIINKKSGALRFHYDHTIDRSLDKSLDSKEKSIVLKNSQAKQELLNVEDIILRKYSNNSQLQLLTYEEMELCGERSKKILPKIGVVAPSRQNTDRSVQDQLYKRLNRMKSEKKINSSFSDLGPYKLGSILGRGNYSIVKLCESSDGKRYAAKVYNKKKINSIQREHNLMHEIKILKSIQHPNIVAFKEHVETEQNHYIITELFDNVSLVDFLKKQATAQQREREEKYGQISSQNNSTRYRDKPRLDQGMARKIFRQVLAAFFYLHGKGIAHRDVKLQNVLIGTTAKKDEIIVKIIDFGFSRNVFESQECQVLTDSKENKKQGHTNSIKGEETVFYDYCGTPSYISPEIMEKKGYLGRPADVWALGVLLFHMVTGNFPFKCTSEKLDFGNSIYNESIYQNIRLSGSLVGMLRKMLKNEAQTRPTVGELLKQNWLNSDS